MTHSKVAKLFMILSTALLAACVQVPQNQADVVKLTQVIPADGYGRTGKMLVGPYITVGDSKMASVHARLAVADGTDFNLQCYVVSIEALNYLNSMESAYASDGTKLVLAKSNDQVVVRIANNVESFTVLLPPARVAGAQATGLTLKIYGTRSEFKLEVPAWYIAGFLNAANRR